jgi:hypothetical protein
VLALSVRPHADEVGFGSYNLVTAEARNLLDAYVAAEVSLARVEGLEMADPADRLVVLRPRESRAIGWRVRVPGGLSRRFLYTFPLLAYSRDGNATAAFRSREDAEVLGRDAADALYEGISAPSAPRLELGCVPTKAAIYSDEAADVACELRNRGDSLDGVKVCLAAACKTVSIPRDGRASAALPVAFTEPGRRTLAITAQAPAAAARALVTIDMEDLPRVSVLRITAPGTVRYGDTFTVTVRLGKESHSVPRNLEGAIRAGRVTADFSLASLPGEHELELALAGRQLRPGRNAINVTVTFEDRNGRSYEASGGTTLELVNVTLWQRLKLLFRSLVGL